MSDGTLDPTYLDVNDGNLSEQSSPINGNVNAYYEKLAILNESLLQRLREHISQLKRLVNQGTIKIENYDTRFIKPEYLPSIDPLIASKVKEEFTNLMVEIESKAKGLKPRNVTKDLNVQTLLQEHRDRLSVTSASTELTTVQRTTVYNLVRQTERDRLNEQMTDEQKPSTCLRSTAKPGGVFRGAARRLGRPPLKGYKWRRATGCRAGSGTIWPSSEHGLFCLLRGFLTQGGERRRLSTAQLCEYVREWQTQMGLRLQRTGGSWSWISRTDDWSAITPHALEFLTAETTPSTNLGASAGVIRHSSRRLLCPRPFVDAKPRVHQWSWLLAPPSATASRNDPQYFKFEEEAKELAELFAEWLRAPRGLGGLSDAEWITSAAAFGGRSRRRKGRTQLAEREISRDHSDSGDSDTSRRLRITDLSGSDDDELNIRSKVLAPKSRQGKVRRTMFILDDIIPPPLCPTTWRLKPFSEEQVIAFQAQETQRFARPWLPFVYRIQNYESVVGPLRSAPSAASQSATVVLHQSTQVKARDHPLLRSDRPIYVSLAEIVRDAVACLPNGEGTRGDITTMVQNSGFLLQFIDQRKLQQCVSSALDRLQGEASDPSVYFNAARRVWVYRHRHRTPEEFAEIHEARCAVNEAKKSLQRGDVRTTNINTATIPKFRNHVPLSRLHYQNTSYLSTNPLTDRSASHSDSTHLQRHLGPPRSELAYTSTSGEEDEASDVHIPDIEELEAADRLRQARGDYLVNSEHSSFYELDEEDDVGDLGYDFGAVQEEQLIVEPTDYMLDDGDGLYPTSFRGPIQPRRVFNPSVRQQHRFRSTYQHRHTFTRNRGTDDFLELHRSLRQ